MSRSSRLATLATALAVPVMLIAPPSADAAPGDTNGPVLVTSGFKSELRELDGSLVSTVTASYADLPSHGEFSPAGDRLAYTRTDCADDACNSWETTIVVRDNLGAAEELGPFEGNVESISWSPDGQQIAFLATPTFDDSTIYRLPLAGGSAVPLVSDTSAFDVDSDGEISWNPAGGSILFVGGEYEPDGGYFNSVHANQLYTVSTSGGAPQRFNQHYPETCDGQEELHTCSFHFRSPEWSPSGTAAVVEVVEEQSSWDGSSDERYLGVISGGDSDPVKVAELRELEDVVSSWRGPSWSPDGTKLLFQDDDGTDLYSATVAAAGGGRTRLPATMTYLHDWQPCPNGVCASWGSRIPTSLTVTALTSGRCTWRGCTATSVQVRGSISPVLQVPVKLRLHARKGGRWVLVDRASATTGGDGTFSERFGKPGGSPCRITVSYAGNAEYAPSSVRKKFTC